MGNKWALMTTMEKKGMYFNPHMLDREQEYTCLDDAVRDFLGKVSSWMSINVEGAIVVSAVFYDMEGSYICERHSLRGGVCDIPNIFYYEHVWEATITIDSRYSLIFVSYKLQEVEKSDAERGLET